METTARRASLAILCWTLTGCTMSGTGNGTLSGNGAPEMPVTFYWKSTDGTLSGTMSATLAGDTFQGRFFQITQQTRAEALRPLWAHWRDGWNDWPYWGHSAIHPYPGTQFTTHYSGKVVATLESTGGQHMRCRFHLVEPIRGMSGGGAGDCQLSNGKVVQASFPSSS